MTAEDVWPLVYVPGSVTVTTTVVGEGEDTAIEPVEADAGFWAVPWPQLIVLVGLTLLIGSSLRGRRRSRARLENKLEQAREEGRRDALKQHA
ncbi:hypothetical protein [Glycomyces lechevalierae]|uniref:Uncharacterized protein n=1 Tax=Glycomyces lechevalierae TaxID=256034 RepID=A0A9X3PR19_9ACTN|nr:hypothetical protein [Glycomyces lechevalierae]MDA1387697.1 hypothetical protein [Glycomyces lechevalierae]MDR7338015.1 hypothetical protein [Glycomyces lechevalierae]